MKNLDIQMQRQKKSTLAIMQNSINVSLWASLVHMSPDYKRKKKTNIHNIIQHL